MKKILMLSLCVILCLTSIIAYADEDKEKFEDQSYPTFIIVKGEENIKAYEDAGIIKPSPERYEFLKLPEIGTMGTSVPTKTRDLNDSSRYFSYSFSSYIYSDYKYLPCPDSLGSTGYGIYHYFEPDASQKMRLSFYSSNGDFEFNSPILDLDDVTAYGTAVKNKAYYIKYTSTEGTRIRGTGEVY